jgi:hypothetical protein
MVPRANEGDEDAVGAGQCFRRFFSASSGERFFPDEPFARQPNLAAGRDAGARGRKHGAELTGRANDQP